MFKIILIFTCISNAYANQSEAMWLYGVDEWTHHPYNKHVRYDRFPLREGINFYDNPKFVGKPVANLTNSVLKDFVTGSICRLDILSHTTQVKNWIYCLPYNCSEVTNKTPIEVVITEPDKTIWRKIDSKTGIDINLCEHQPQFDIMTTYASGYYRWLVLPTGSHEVVFGVKKIFPDTRFCNEKKTRIKCSFDLKTEETDRSIIQLEKNSRNSMPLSSYISKKCSNDNISKNCLNDISMDDSDRKNFKEQYGYMVKNVIWTSENISEFKACLKNGSQIDDITFRGIKKKCMRINSKIAVIDYPQAFILDRPLPREKSNFFKP